MDLATRKYNFIQELFSIDNESVMMNLERILKQEKDQIQEVSIANKKELDTRLESYKKNPENVLDWNDVKQDW